MKEIPILLNTEMVQAILDGRKTMTRRTRGLEKVNKTPNKYNCAGTYHILTDYHFEAFFINPENIDKIEAKCHYGLPGDVLWVRETHMYVGKPNIEYIFKCGYPANLHPDIVNIPSSKCIAWKPSIHMPKSAARIWLEVEEIRVERLQDITEEDAIAEGVGMVDTAKVFAEKYPYKCYLDNDNGYNAARSSFLSLFEKINGFENGNCNPWVWVVKFKVLSTAGKPQINQ